MLTLSASGFVSGTDFVCTSSYCEARGLIASAAFRALQAGANTLAARLRLPSSNQVSVDGKIGQRTVDLIQLLAISVPINAQSSLSTYWSTSKAEVAKDAAALAAEIGLLLQSSVNAGTSVAPPGSVPVVSSGRPPSATAPQLPSPGGIAPIPSAGTTITPVGPIFVPHVPLKKLAIGLGVAGALVLGGVAISQRRKKRR
jgi:hypothetical protein